VTTGTHDPIPFDKQFTCRTVLETFLIVTTALFFLHFVFITDASARVHRIRSLE